MLCRSSLSAYVLASLLCLLCTSAQAEDVGYEKLVEEAISEFSRGNFVEARTLFALAHEKQPNARTFRGLGIVEYELRDYVQAIAHFEGALTDTRNKISKQQRAEVQELLERAKRFVGRFKIELEPASATLTLDGRATTAPDGVIALNPGTYMLGARASGYTEQTVKLTVRGSENESVALRLEPARLAEVEPEQPALDPVPVAPPPTEPVEESSSSGPPVASIVAFGVGGAGLVTFAIAGGMGLAKDSELEKCSPTCPESSVDTAKTYLLVADIGLVVGLAGVATGAILWILDDGEERPDAQARVTPWLAPGLAGAQGTLRF